MSSAAGSFVMMQPLPAFHPGKVFVLLCHTYCEFLQGAPSVLGAHAAAAPYIPVQYQSQVCDG